jgi:hypothetical protein
MSYSCRTRKRWMSRCWLTCAYPCDALSRRASRHDQQSLDGVGFIKHKSQSPCLVLFEFFFLDLSYRLLKHRTWGVVDSCCNVTPCYVIPALSTIFFPGLSIVVVHSFCAESIKRYHIALFSLHHLLFVHVIYSLKAVIIPVLSRLLYAV